MSRQWRFPLRVARWTIFLVLAACTAPADAFLLEPNRAGKIIVGMPTAAIYQIYPPEITKQVDLQLEGMPTPAVQVFLTKDKGTPSLVIRLDGPNPGVYGIDVRDARFKTRDGIGVGSSLGQLRKMQKNLSIVVGEGNFGAAVDGLSMSFFLQLDRQTEKRFYETGGRYLRGDNPLIPDETKITSVWVHWSPGPSNLRRE